MPRGIRRTPVLAQRVLQAWSGSSGSTAEAARWALERIEYLERRNVELTRELDKLKSDARIGQYLAEVRKPAPAAAGSS